MKLPYRTELNALAETYAQARSTEIDPIRHAVDAVGGDPALFIGSGGSMVIAELAAYLHEERCRQPGRACTALEALEAPQLSRRGGLLFSSSAKHPDAKRVFEDFRRRRFAPAVLVTHRDTQEVQEAAGLDTLVVTLPPLAQGDGFLATGSILQLATLLLRAHGLENGLPSILPGVGADEGPLRDEVLVLAPSSLRSVATDIEVRLVESGLAAVQVSDYRNFAHGRHTGFARRSERVTVIALSASNSEALATGTVGTLPDRCDVRRWHVDGSWEEALITLLHRSMRLAGTAGDRVGLDVARPRVPTFGRRLYRLSLHRRLPGRPVGGIERKLLAAGFGDDEAARTFYEEAASAWREQVARERFAGVVLDYDGTVCWTQQRLKLPELAVRDRLCRILDDGALIGFASGRGRSLHVDLRRWLPPEQWDRVIVGLYNGGVVLSLSDELPDLREPTAWSHAVVSAITAMPNAGRLGLTERGAQVTVNALGVSERSTITGMVLDHLMAAEVQASVAVSGHSIDVVPHTSSKLAVVRRVAERAAGSTLAIGDQGQVGGNDHALLAGHPATLTVDRCSADSDSCWFIGTGDRVGPALLEAHLRSLLRRRGGLALTGLEVA